MPSKELEVPSSSIPFMIDHNAKGSQKSILTHKRKRKTAKTHKGTIRDILSNEHVNSFIFPEIRSSGQRFGDASRMTGLTSGTNEDIPSQFNDQTIEYYS